MKGLLKNNYFAVRSNAKAFSVFMLLLGIFVVAVISPSLLMGYSVLSARQHDAGVLLADVCCLLLDFQ